MSDTKKYAFGMIGLGVMGRNLLLNIGDHGFAGAGFDKDAAKGQLLEQEDKNGNLKGFSTIEPFVASLSTPRAIMMLVPAGKIVDDVIAELTPLLDKGDIVIDGGNSHFTDTNRRVEYLEAQGFHFFGMGVSGGEEGARRGPSIMPGGDKKAYEVMKPILEAISAKAEDGLPCVAYCGPGAAGHFVKMVHNGIEYGMMQLIAETYEIMKNGLSLDNERIGKIYEEWNEGRLKSFLLEVTRDVFKYKAPDADHLLIDDIKDEARSKGTGKWTSQVAMDLQAPIPTIDTAVAMRDLSKYKALRVEAAELYGKAETITAEDTEKVIAELEQSLYFTMIISYAQGLHLLTNASVEYKYDLNLAEISKIWRAGCIIRSQFLYDIYNAYTNNPGLQHLLLDAGVAKLVNEVAPGIRSVLSKTVAAGIAAPAFNASLSYFEAFRSARMPSNVIQAQRDYFGAHTYELIGKEGTFHTQWVPKKTE
ncbi:NADP-dependent phosphogluconate dehydrogenase [Mucilaginibacter myungsuensis]|uniref:6-phosphogluconate dehydrogenase, decarboxylating n=1 Tax=Mucilaginibacter myungsuensis TaxID=649104 RepID=A0A929KWU7_9SPHI|nr:NADP-dependent phosphogluconate dehydrogenase [Mucilaginibacter myungsuensis]MBE9661915.1 NADP-dependent phosphogluconate dehydrogenase [Mucilaginibacter myungsuensis]MDN3599651.1 NADP-dependent phosphogluconate dehydrogenase [Mucilaginibacter myungsuensis]